MRQIPAPDISVTAAESGRYPATWGQRAFWRNLLWRGPDDVYFNYVGSVPVPPGTSLMAVGEALRAALTSCETLRTTYHGSPAQLVQQLHADGTAELTVHVVQEPDEVGEDGAATRAVLEEMQSRSFRLDQDWPIRFAVLCHGESPVTLGFCFNRMAMDAEGTRLMAALLTDCLAGRKPTAPQRQPRHQAVIEESPAGRAANEAALAHWRKALATTIPSMFDLPAGKPEPERFVRYRLTSAALTVAARLVASRTATSTSAVLLAAYAVILERLTGHSRLGLQLIAGNRLDPELADYVGSLAQDAVLAVCLGDVSSFDEAVRHCFRASTVSYWNGAYDPDAARKLREAQRWTDGAHRDLGVYFNDTRQPSRGGSSGQPADGVRLEPADTSRAVPDGSWARVDARCFLTVAEWQEATLLSLQTDTAYLPVPVLIGILEGVERLVVAAAATDVDRKDFTRVVDVSPLPRDPALRARDETWASTAACREILSEAAAPCSVAVFDDQEGGSVGYVAAHAPGATPETLHGAFLAALDERTDTRAPSRYVVCDGAPECVDEQAAWLARPVLIEGDGRRRS